MPLLPLLAAFAAGVGFLQSREALPEPEAAPWLAVAFGLACCWCMRVRGRHRVSRSRTAAFVLTALATAAFIGYGYAALRAAGRLADALPERWEGEDIAIVGVVDGLPRAAERGQRFSFAVERVDTPGAIVPSRLSLAWQARWPDAQRGIEVPVVRAGERWAITVRLKRPHGTLNRGAFDLEAWLLERNLRASGYVRPDEPSRRLASFAGRPLDHVHRARERIRDAAVSALPGGEHAAVLVALAIGDQAALGEAQWTLFNRTGTGHLISVSGLHVTVFALLAGGLAFALARQFPRLTSRVPARKLAAAFGWVASFGYVLLAGAEVPAQRTLVMLGVSALGLWLSRPGTGLVVWTWALVLVLAWDPWAVLAPGFWLSFFAVGLLIYVSSGRSEAPRGDWRARMRHRLARAASAQWAITVGLVPLALALFQQVSLIGPLANAIAIPVVTFAIVPATLAAALLEVDALWRFAHAVLAPLMRLLEVLAAQPGAVWAQHQPPAWAVVAGGAGAALCLAPRGVPGRPLGLVGLATLILVLPRPPPAGSFRMTVLDVGQGTAVVIQTQRHALVYDAGPWWHEAADAGGRIVAPFLRAAGIRRLDALVISHRDLDHAGGALAVLQAVPVGALLSSLPLDSEIVERHEARGLHLRCESGQAWEWDGVRFEMLFPERVHYEDRWRKSNDVSCVVRVVGERASALLAGDIEAVSEIELVASRREALAADVLVVPHHGSRTSSTSSFVAAVAPRHAVFTVGYRNRFGHPRADIVARYDAAGASTHRTDVAGALTFDFDAPGPGPPAGERVLAARYWHARPR